jgi:hypothetical protein
MDVSGQLHALATSPSEKVPPVPFRPQSWSGNCREKSFAPAGIQTLAALWSILKVSSHLCTDLSSGFLPSDSLAKIPYYLQNEPKFVIVPLGVKTVVRKFVSRTFLSSAWYTRTYRRWQLLDRNWPLSIYTASDLCARVWSLRAMMGDNYSQGWKKGYPVSRGELILRAS